MGLAASMSGGLMAFQSDGAWSKWLHVGWAAQGGIVAADLAARGFVGPLAALDGTGNLFAAMLAGETLDLHATTRQGYRVSAVATRDHQIFLVSERPTDPPDLAQDILRSAVRFVRGLED